MNVSIFCSSQEPSERQAADVHATIGLLVKAGHHIVWGGSTRGLMKTVGDSGKLHGARLIAIGHERWKDDVHEAAHEYIMAITVAERKTHLVERADAFLAFPGGTGTLDEIVDTLEQKKLGYQEKPFVILNTEGFYDGLRMQLECMESEGFMPCALDSLVYFASTPEQVLEGLA